MYITSCMHVSRSTEIIYTLTQSSNAVNTNTQNYTYLRIWFDCWLKIFEAKYFIWYCFCLIMQDRIDRDFAINPRKRLQLYTCLIRRIGRLNMPPHKTHNLNNTPCFEWLFFITSFSLFRTMICSPSLFNFLSFVQTVK